MLGLSNQTCVQGFPQPCRRRRYPPTMAHALLSFAHEPCGGKGGQYNCTRLACTTYSGLSRAGLEQDSTGSREYEFKLQCVHENRSFTIVCRLFMCHFSLGVGSYTKSVQIVFVCLVGLHSVYLGLYNVIH